MSEVTVFLFDLPNAEMAKSLCDDFGGSWPAAFTHWLDSSGEFFVIAVNDSTGLQRISESVAKMHILSDVNALRIVLMEIMSDFSRSQTPCTWSLVVSPETHQLVYQTAERFDIQLGHFSPTVNKELNMPSHRDGIRVAVSARPSLPLGDNVFEPKLSPRPFAPPSHKPAPLPARKEHSKK